MEREKRTSDQLLKSIKISKTKEPHCGEEAWLFM